jgi:signal transduction histidine kinase
VLNSLFSLKSSEDYSIIIVKDGIVIETNHQFINLTGYSSKDLINKKITDIFNLLRVGPNINFETFDCGDGYFLFTKSFEVRFVEIEIIKNDNEEIYIISEKANSRIEDKFNYLNIHICENIAGIFIFSVPDFTLLKASQLALDSLDVPYNTCESTNGKPVYEFIPEWKESDSEKCWRDICTTGKPKSIKEHRYINFQRGITYWDTTLTPIKEKEVVKYLVIHSQDVTERVLARQKLEEKNEIISLQKRQLETIVNGLSSYVSIIDRNGNFVKRDNVLEKNNFEIRNIYDNKTKGYVYYDLDSNQIPKDETPLFKILRGQNVNHIKYKVVINNEKEIYVSSKGMPVLDENGDVLVYIVISQDITDLMHTTRELNEKNNELKSIIDNMSDALFIINPDGTYKYYNKRAFDMAYKAEKVKKTGDTAAHTEYFDMNGVKLKKEELPSLRVLKGERIDDLIIKAIRPDKVTYLSFTGSPVYDSNGKMISGTVCIRDMTFHFEKEKALEENRIKLLQAEREKNESLEKVLEMKDEFLSFISHEFRTPLNVINSAIQAMEYICGSELPEKAKKYIRMINQNTLRQLRLVNNLLDITRVNAGRIKVSKKNHDIVFLTRSITDSVLSYASQKEISITFVSSIKSKVLGIDDEKYERILLNLLSNAIKFTPKGKCITVTICSIKNSICIEVKDDGIGIPTDKVDLIFEKFGQVDSSLSRQAEGSGIGLSLVKKFVELLGGSITVKSKVGMGSTFTILLPDETIVEEHSEKEMIDLLDNRLIQTTNVEFSDIYL